MRIVSESPKVEKFIEVDNLEQIITLFGSFDENVKIIESELDVCVAARERQISVSGGETGVDTAIAVMTRLMALIRKSEPVDRSRIRYAIELAREGNAHHIEEIMSGVVAVTYRGKQIKCKTVGQKKYIQAIKDNTLVFGIGPAGTGKTYLAIAMAVIAFKNKEVSRIILTRPAVEAGEKLGFLPGDLQNKVDPYLRPLYDALYDFIGTESFAKLMERGVIEVAPLAYMRGRTLNDSFIILDEAQNCTAEQMKMFLTRFGEGSRVVVTGDITQVDLPPDRRSGLKHAADLLRNVKNIETVRLTHKDVVRHELVQEIIKAYESQEGRRRGET